MPTRGRRSDKRASHPEAVEEEGDFRWQRFRGRSRPERAISSEMCEDDHGVRCYARSNPRLMRCAPPRRTEACARRPPRTARSGGSICVATLQKRGLSPLPTHQPPLTPLKRPTLPTGQGLAQAEKPNPACKAASPAPSLKPSAAHGQTDRPSREAATDGIGDQPRPQWAFSSDESTHQLSSIAQVHAMAAGCFHRLSAQPHRDAPPRAQSFPRP